MYIRCAGCGTTTRVEPTDIDSGVACMACKRHHDLSRAHKMGSTPTERYEHASAFAREKRIDLASAYSVLLGIIPLERALPISVDERHDRGYDEAISLGFMTVQQAIERGDRVLHASTLQQRHGFSMDTAFQVTDNRLRLFEALALQSDDAPTPASERPSTRGVWNIAQVAVAVVIVGAGMIALFRAGKQPAAMAHGPSVSTSAPGALPSAAPDSSLPPVEPQATVTFRTDEQGRVTEVSGPDPKTVLEGLCGHAQFAGAFVPMAVAPSVPPSAGDRLGFVRDRNDPAVQRSVSIRRDFRTGRWSAGDGRAPLEIQRAPTTL